jgi:uncharacterized membrane protein YedE/YeeE
MHTQADSHALADKVVGFLDVLSVYEPYGWNPSLAFVMGGAVVVNFFLFRSILHRSRPFFAVKFSVPTVRTITPSLVGGSALFGMGWGLAGVCPGPGLVSLASGSPVALLFVPSMVAGMLLFNQLERRRAKKA